MIQSLGGRFVIRIFSGLAKTKNSLNLVNENEN